MCPNTLQVIRLALLGTVHTDLNHSTNRLSHCRTGMVIGGYTYGGEGREDAEQQQQTKGWVEWRQEGKGRSGSGRERGGVAATGKGEEGQWQGGTLCPITTA